MVALAFGPLAGRLRAQLVSRLTRLTVGARILDRRDVPLTCGLLGIAVLGAASGDGKRRQTWLGAALFGVGYITLALGLSHDSGYWPGLPTDHLLAAVREVSSRLERFPRNLGRRRSRERHIMAALERPVPMRFLGETPLEDVVKYVQAVTTGRDGKTIPIYVDPIGLQEADKNMNSTVVMDLEGVALGQLHSASHSSTSRTAFATGSC